MARYDVVLRLSGLWPSSNSKVPCARSNASIAALVLPGSSWSRPRSSEIPRLLGRDTAQRANEAVDLRRFRLIITTSE
jgi:hypothetical protein